MNGYQWSYLLYKFFLIILAPFFTFCVNDISLESNQFFDIVDTQVEVNKFDNELFLQAEVNYWNDIDNIVSVKAELSIYTINGFQTVGTYILGDEGGLGDIIKGNGIYTLLTTANQLDFIDIDTEIKSITMDSSYALAQSGSDSLDIELEVSGKPLQVMFTAEDIDGILKTHIDYLNLSNTYIEIQINSDSMYRDIDNDDDCNRQWNQSNNSYQFYFNITNYNIIENSNLFSYSTKIPFRPINECGGTGQALFKFNLHDLDYSNCISNEDNLCQSNLTSFEDKVLMIVGCGDNWCTEGYESHPICPEDCFCGNGTCDEDETNSICPEECE